MTHGFKEKYSISYTSRIRKFDAVFRMFTKVVVSRRMPSCLVEDGHLYPPDALDVNVLDILLKFVSVY